MSSGRTDGELTPEEEQRVREVREFLGEFVKTAWLFFIECEDNPKPGSFIARANPDPDLVQVLDARIWVDAAGDFFLSVAQELHGAIHRYAPYTTLRGAMEWDARACWLLDPDVEDKIKLGRALTFRARSLYEMKRLRLPPEFKSHDQNYIERMKRVTDSGTRWGLEAKNLDSHRVCFVPTPGPTAMIRCLLAEPSDRNFDLTVGEQSYGELSARAHGAGWAATSGVTPVALRNDLQTWTLSQIDLSEFLRLLGISVALHDKAIRRVALAAGLDGSVWEARRGPMPW